MATNEFKAFATAGGANVLSQEEYLALAALSTGFQSGIAKSAEMNKALRQATTGVAALTQFISEATDSDINDNGDVSALVTKLAAALAARGLSRENPFADIAADGTVNQALANLGLGEAAKRSVGADANQIPDMSFFTSAKGDNGYFSLPDGTIVQYGRATTVRNNEVGTVTLPFAFPARFSQVVITHDDASTASAIAFGSATPKTVSTFQVVVQKLNFNTSTGAVTLRTDVSPCYIRYFAVGS